MEEIIASVQKLKGKLITMNEAIAAMKLTWKK